MAKLMEKNGAEMCAALVEIAAALRRFMDDAAFDEAWKKATKKGLKTGMTDVLKIYADLAPLLFGETHLHDTLAILSVIEGKPVSELLEMPGVELMADALAAFNDQLKPFISRGGKRS